MSDEEVKIEEILPYLHSDVLSDQATALVSLRDLVKKIPLKAADFEKLQSFLMGCVDDRENSVRSDVFGVLAEIGKKRIDYMDKYWEKFLQEIQTKNPFTVTYITDLCGAVHSHPRPQVQAMIRELLKHWDWFNNEALLLLYKAFFKKVCDGTFSFIKMYLPELTQLVSELQPSHLPHLPPALGEIRELLTTKIGEYQEIVKEAERQKIQREEEEKVRQAKAQEAQQIAKEKRKAEEDQRTEAQRRAAEAAGTDAMKGKTKHPKSGGAPTTRTNPTTPTLPSPTTPTVATPAVNPSSTLSPSSVQVPPVTTPLPTSPTSSGTSGTPAKSRKKKTIPASSTVPMSDTSTSATTISTSEATTEYKDTESPDNVTFGSLGLRRKEKQE